MVITAAAAADHPQKSIWQMKWRDIEYQLTELKAYNLERPPISNVTVRLMVEHSLKSCRELGLWLWETADLSQGKRTTAARSRCYNRPVHRWRRGWAGEAMSHEVRLGCCSTVAPPTTAWRLIWNP